jgi:hypothetical protein
MSASSLQEQDLATMRMERSKLVWTTVQAKRRGVPLLRGRDGTEEKGNDVRNKRHGKLKQSQAIDGRLSLEKIMKDEFVIMLRID